MVLITNELVITIFVDNYPLVISDGDGSTAITITFGGTLHSCFQVMGAPILRSIWWRSRFR